MRKILILFAHPALQKSRHHRHLMEAVRGLDGITINDLYEEYPEFNINVQREQQLLLDHDVIVLQFPFFWYSTPAILKDWQDLVLEYNFAYGREGVALHGKHTFCAISAGGRRESYTREGHNRYTVNEFLRPIEGTFYLCGVFYHPPFVLYGAHQRERFDLETERYRWLLQSIRDESLKLEELAAVEELNEIIPSDLGSVPTR